MAAIEMTVDRVLLDPVLGTPVLVLGEVGGQRQLPIGIGQVEAVAIVSQIESIPMMRPMTHDLMRDLLGQLGATVERVTVTSLRDGIYYAELTLRAGSSVLRVDSRPSDAVALALRTGARIFVEEAVVDVTTAERAAACAEAAEATPKALVVEEDCSEDLLESLPDEDFGKWKM
jgi:bifunctional DNase/RNase